VILDLLRRRPGPLRRPRGAIGTAAFAAGGLLLVWSAYIHFHLWDSVGYRSIPTIGALFVLQSVAGLVFGLAALGARRLWTAVLGAGFALSTVGGFLLTVSLPKGLFNFKETWLAPFAQQAFGIELVAAALLVVAGALCADPVPA
jgi:hypothetical protein